jgi:hypothetical protein
MWRDQFAKGLIVAADAPILFTRVPRRKTLDQSPARSCVRLLRGGRNVFIGRVVDFAMNTPIACNIWSRVTHAHRIY